MYKKVSSDMNFVDREKETVKFWKEYEIFEKSIEERKDDPTYTFYDGPPTANGKPHIGHVLTRVIKDMIPRYQTMKGHKIIRKAGWDTHGLPVELEVEKMLGLDGKEQIEEYGMEPFIKKCKESVWKYKGVVSKVNLAESRSADELLDEAVNKAKSADYVVFVGGLNKNSHQDCEGGDRTSYGLPYGQDRVIEALSQANPRTIVVLISGNSVAMPWIDQVPAIV